MPRRQANSELLTEGCHSYHKALFAVMQFRREVQEVIRAAIDKRINDLADALQLDKAEVTVGLTAYTNPATLAQNWDGSSVEVGFRFPSKPWDAKWGIYFYFWITDEEGGCASAYCYFKEPGPALRHLASFASGRLETNKSGGWILEPIGKEPDDFIAAVGRVLDRWIELWRKAGGIKQFLPAGTSLGQATNNSL
jgi:hypothetical protein